MNDREHLEPGNGAAAELDDDRLEPLLINLARRGLDLVDGQTREEVQSMLARGDALARMTSRERSELSVEIRRLCYQRNLPEVLALSGVPSVYNFREEYERNFLGPWDRFPDRDGVTRGRRWSLMGFDIGFPVGIPASVLTANARWIEYYARQGFNLITYKTVRSQHWDAHGYPNWVFLQGLDQPLPVPDGAPGGEVVGDTQTFFADPRAFSTANSFGVPSEDPDIWKRDVADAIDRLGDGKLLMVSVMGTAERSELQDPARLAEDFAETALHAQEAGAPAVELNLSCPNTLDRTAGEITPPICLDADLTATIVHRVADALAERNRNTRLVCKLSWMRREHLGHVLEGFADRVDAVSGINTLPYRVVGADGRPTFPGRKVAGVSGIAIRDFGVDFVRSVDALRRQRNLDLALIGMGGVMTAGDVRVLLREGADAVQTATAASHNPTLPTELLREPDRELSGTARELIALLESRKGADLAVLANGAGATISAVRAGLLELERWGLVVEGTDPERPRFSLDEEALERLTS